MSLNCHPNTLKDRQAYSFAFVAEYAHVCSTLQLVLQATKLIRTFKQSYPKCVSLSLSALDYFISNYMYRTNDLF